MKNAASVMLDPVLDGKSKTAHATSVTNITITESTGLPKRANRIAPPTEPLAGGDVLAANSVC